MIEDSQLLIGKETLRAVSPVTFALRLPIFQEKLLTVFGSELVTALASDQQCMTNFRLFEGVAISVSNRGPHYFFANHTLGHTLLQTMMIGFAFHELEAYAKWAWNRRLPPEPNLGMYHFDLTNFNVICI